jgi:lantibiotic biosynthesis protein
LVKRRADDYFRQKMPLFPYILLRVAGLPFDVLERYNHLPKQSEAAFLQLQHDILSQVIQQALPFSSLDFKTHLHCFLEKNPNQFRKKEFQKARTALKYLTRTAAKCSPFADFTTLELMKLAEETKQYPKAEKYLINLELLTYFQRKCLENEAIRDNLIVKKNPTLSLNDNEWVWIAMLGNQEVLQRTENDEVLSIILNLPYDVPHFTFSTLLKKLKKTLGQSKQVKQYILQLFDVGMLEFVMPFGKNQAAFQELAAFFKANLLEDKALDVLLAVQKNGGCDEISLRTLANHFDFREESLFFKDVSSNFFDIKKNIDILKPHFEHSIALFQQVAAVLVPLVYDKMKEEIFKYLERCEHSEVAAIELYEGIFHHSEWHKLFLQTIKENRATIESWLLQNIDFREDKVEISQEQLQLLQHFASKLEAQPLMQLPSTYNLVLQPFSDGKMFLSGASIGYGKQFLRFLHLFDNEYLINEFKIKSEKNRTYLELNDDSLINANEHQIVADYELSHHNSWNKQQPTLSLSDLKVLRNKEGIWHLINKNGENIVPLDLGLEHPSRRSPSYQLLMGFAETVPSITLLNNLLNRCYEQKFPDSLYFPPIIIDNQLFTQRKHWYFNVEDLPKQQPKMTKESYAMLVNDWATSNDLPQYVFVSIPFEINANTPHNRLSPDDYKPQFIDFQNILLIDLFGKMINRVPEMIKFEEMLPSPNDLFQFEGQKRVYEVVVQGGE